jgi:acyl-CoA thioester hydrolase
VEGFHWVRTERVRFRDCDAMGHVNNAVYSTFFEEARIDALGGLADFILARVEIDFLSELRAGEQIEVGTRCSRIGNKSLDLEHEIHANGRIAARAKSVLVGYDYARGESAPLPEELKSRLSASRASA